MLAERLRTLDSRDPAGALAEDPRDRIARQDAQTPDQFRFWAWLFAGFVFSGVNGYVDIDHRWVDWINWAVGAVLVVGICWEAFSYIQRRRQRGIEPNSATPVE